MKRNVSVLVCFLVAVICLGGCAKKITEGDFVIKKEALSDVFYLIKYTGSATSVEVPAKIQGHDVQGATDGAFKDLPNLQKVTFLGKRTSILDAFENCPNLSSVIITGETGYISDNAFKNCPSMPTKAASASSGSGNSSSSSSSKSGVVGSWRRVSAYATGGNTSRSSWKTVDDSRLGTGINIPSQFIVNSNGTASANNLSFTWSGSGSNITFTYSSSGNIRASYNANAKEIYMQMPALYNGKVDLIAVTYK
jgi:hypothetical protein